MLVYSITYTEPFYREKFVLVTVVQVYTVTDQKLIIRGYIWVVQQLKDA